MEIIASRESLGVAEADRKYVRDCMELQDSWKSQQKSVVVLDSGKLVASELCWTTELQELMNIDSLCRGTYSRLEWCIAPVDLIREALTEGDAKIKERISGVQSSVNQQTSAKQVLMDIVLDALRKNATDIHFRLTGSEARVAFRISGALLSQGARSRTSITEALAAVLNTESDDFQSVFDEHSLNAASITLPVPAEAGYEGKEVRIRAQKSPCLDGFTVTLRLQTAKSINIPDLSALGFSAEATFKLRELMKNPSGLILISGPTGHGKTTSLAALNTLIPGDRKIISLEDPIEIIQPAVEQKFVPTDQNPEAFPAMIKVVMREDPDVIEVSEIRDLETARAAITAALTGHLVLSTIHANSSLGIISRLMDLGITAAQLSQPDLLVGLLAQRLVPRLCSSCKQKENHPVWGECSRRNPSGCPGCAHSGHIGRVLVSELVTTELSELESGCLPDFGPVKRRLAQTGCGSMATETLWLIRQQQVDPVVALEIVPGLQSENNSRELKRNAP